MVLIRRFCECLSLRSGVFILAICDILVSGLLLCDYMLQLPGQIKAFRELNIYSKSSLDLFKFNMDIAVWALVADIVMVLLMLLPPSLVDPYSSTKSKKCIRIVLIPSLFIRLITILHGVAAVIWLPLELSIYCAEIYGLMIANGLRVLLGLYLVVIGISFFQELGETAPVYKKAPTRMNFEAPKFTEDIPIPTKERKERKPKQIHYYAKANGGKLEPSVSSHSKSNDDLRREGIGKDIKRREEERRSQSEDLEPEVPIPRPYQGRKRQSGGSQESKSSQKQKRRSQERSRSREDIVRVGSREDIVRGRSREDLVARQQDDPDGEIIPRYNPRKEAPPSYRKPQNPAHNSREQLDFMRPEYDYQAPQRPKHARSREELNSNLPSYDYHELQQQRLKDDVPSRPMFNPPEPRRQKYSSSGDEIPPYRPRYDHEEEEYFDHKMRPLHQQQSYEEEEEPGLYTVV